MPYERFEQFFTVLEQARKRSKPRRVDLRMAWCLLRTGRPWRALSSDFSTWRTVHSYLTKGCEPDEDGESLPEQALKSGRRGPRETRRKVVSTLMIADAQGLKNTDMAGQMAGKKLTEIKRHTAIDTQGWCTPLPWRLQDVAQRTSG